MLHQYNKKKNEKKRCEEEWNQRRQNTYPGVRPQQHSQQHLPLPPHPQYIHDQQSQQHLAIPQQKYACYAPQPQLQPQPFSPVSPSSPVLIRPHTAQTFPQPYPPQFSPQPQFQQPQPVPWIQHPEPQPLQRIDTFTSISNMPVANGLGSPHPHLPPRPTFQTHPQSQPHLQNGPYYLQPISPHSPISPMIAPVNSPYGNPGFSRSTPNFTHPAPTELRYDNNSSFGRNTVDDVDAYETNAPPSSLRVQDVRPEEDENDPPPPYRP